MQQIILHRTLAWMLNLPPAPPFPCLKVSAHVGPDPCVIKEALDAADSADGNILVPELPVRKVHDVLLRDAINDALNLSRAHPPPGGDDLPADILGDSRRAV